MEEAMSWKENTVFGHREKDNSLGLWSGLFSLSVVNNARKDLGFLPVSPPSAPPLPAAGFVAPPSRFPELPTETQAAGEKEAHRCCISRDQLSFLNEPVGPKASSASPDDVLYAEECRSPIGADLFPYGIGWSTAANGVAQRRSCSVSDLCLGGDPAGAGWKPCLYFARGYCKNGNSCRFLHGLSDDTAEVISGKMDAVVEEPDLLLRSKSQRIMSSAATAFPYPAAGSLPHSPSSNGKCMNFLFQQQQSDCQRRVFLDKMTSFFTLHLYKTRRFCQLYRTAAAAASAAATALILGGEDTHNFIGRPRMERCDFPA
ncbi:hypothetical protein HPP92_001634 [Vanilla planifolia]|uniref:C3H1-type domain-containing protein n=1 Tax=Vanilla planifolia TaxID=51239 RepID=A0A835VH45_VANPL|nr:hypothetical protein HPP92_001634 [Vanilla planifolia]